MELMSLEIAAAFGFRDRILGIDSGEREAIISRFRGCKRLEHAHWAGWLEADHYCGNVAKWAQGDLAAA
jgi:hypothetical protein